MNIVAITTATLISFTYYHPVPMIPMAMAMMLAVDDWRINLAIGAVKLVIGGLVAMDR